MILQLPVCELQFFISLQLTVQCSGEEQYGRLCLFNDAYLWNGSFFYISLGETTLDTGMQQGLQFV